MTLTLPAANKANLRPRMSIEQIISIMRQRRSQDALLIRQMIEVRDRVNGDVVLPVPDVEGAPTIDIPIPRLIAMAVDSNARRAASSKPTINCPALNPASKRSVQAADMRRKMMYAKWTESQLDIKSYRFYRHLAAYGTAAVCVMPDNETRTAKIELRDPLTAYPELRDPSDIRVPRNVGFIYGRSVDWITTHYPQAKDFFANAAIKEWDTLWDVVEWIDEFEIIIGIMGPRIPAYSPQDARPYGYGGWELSRYTNLAGIVPVAMPRRVTLDRVMGQMSTMVDTVDLYSRMTALSVLAAEKHTFPDMAIMSADNQEAHLTNGQWRAGATGEVNILNGARSVEYLQANQAPYIQQTLQNLENTIRQSGGASEIMSGDNAGMRTGRGLDVMGSFSIDPQVQEMQRTFAQTLSVVNEACVAVEKGYYPSHKHVCFTGLKGDNAILEYKASDLDSGLNAVEYPLPGTDVSQASVAIGQMVGAGLMSKHTARSMHPLIDDAHEEESSTWVEMLEQTMLQAVAQQAGQGAIPPSDLANITAKVRAGARIEDAITEAQKDAQKRQAQMAPPPGAGEAAAPETQPGLGPPGQGAEQPPQGSISPPAPGLAAYHQIATALKQAPPPQPLNAPPGGP